MKPWMQDNDIEMYSTHNEAKSIVAEGFIRNTDNKIFKYMTPLSKLCIFMTQLTQLHNQKEAFNKKNSKEETKFEVGDHL